MQAKIILQPEHIYHIYNRGNNRRKIFKERENYIYFLKLMKKYIAPIANIYAYALLPDHFHILLEIKNQTELDKLNISESKDISLKFSNWFNAYAKAFNKKHNEIGSLFEKGFERSLIRSDEQFTRLIYYIHWNPNKHGYVKDFKTWEFTSYKSIISDKPSLLEREYILNWFGSNEEFIRDHEIIINDAPAKKLIFE